MTAEPARALGPRRWLRCRPRTCRARSSPKSNTSRLRGRDETAVDVVLGNRAETLTLGAQVSPQTPSLHRKKPKLSHTWGPARHLCFRPCPPESALFFTPTSPTTVQVPNLALFRGPSLSATSHPHICITHTHTQTHTILDLPVLPLKVSQILPHLSISTAITLIPTPFSLIWATPIAN